ncbi:T-complex protein 11 [Lotmaria passim]
MSSEGLEDAGQTSPLPKAKVCIADTMRELSGVVQQLEDLGLSLDPLTAPSADEVEHTLITDSWSCPVCGTAASAICPVSGKPHRRRLVAIAQHALRLVERHVGKVYVRPAQLSQQVEGEVQVRTHRRLIMNPHTFLLAFYFAAGAPSSSPSSVAAASGAGTADDAVRCDDSHERSSLTAECARHLLDVLREIKLYGATSPTDDKCSLSLLKSFRGAWRQYLRQVRSEMSDQGSGAAAAEGGTGGLYANSAEARDELVKCTRAALMDAVTHSRKEPNNHDLRAFTAMLYQRLSRLCTKEEFTEVKRRVEQIEAYDTTPKIEYASPPCLLSDANTTASDEETQGDVDAPSKLSSSSSATAQRRIGPDLPPGWYVDGRGVSRPPANLAETQRRERYRQQETKAQKAYEAVMGVKREKGQAEELQASTVAALDKAELQALAADLNRGSPRLHRLSRLLAIVEDRFVDALPPWLRSRVRLEFHDVLDWNAIQRRARGNALNIANLVRFIGQQVITYSAPVREAATTARMAAICDDIERCVPDVGTAVANAFEFLFDAITQLRTDVATYSLLLINDTLKQNAVQYIREFISSCLPPPPRWAKSIAFLQSSVNDVRAQTWASTRVPQAWTSLTEPERRVRGALLIGTLDLLRSGRHTSLDRWDELPPEIFYFEKHVVFKAANTVQECTLLLLLEGTVSSVLAGRGVKAATVSATILKLHRHILQLLSQDIKLNALKDAVTDFIESELYHLHTGEKQAAGAAAMAALAAQVTLTEAERQVVRSTIDKMTDTQNQLYVTFEKRVIQFMESMLVHNRDDVAPMGLVTDTLKRLAQLLWRMLAFHCEVYAPFYQELIPLLTIDSAAPASASAASQAAATP